MFDVRLPPRYLAAMDAAPAAPDPQHDAKLAAAAAAADRVESRSVLGIGSGSTAALFIAELGRRLADGKLHHVCGIPTSRESEQLAQTAGIPLTTFADEPHCDLTVDGADEVSPDLDLIKGLGGALLREKVVAQNSRRLLIIADGSKTVAHLGEKGPLPVEVAVYGYESQFRFLMGLGCEPVLRHRADGMPFVTDNGNYIYDCRFGRIADPAELNVTLLRRAGVVETGLFLGIADTILVADADGVREMKRA